MLDGAKSGFDPFEFEMRAFVSPGSYGADQQSIGCITTGYYALNSADVEIGVDLRCNSTQHVGPSPIGRHANLEIPPLGISQAYSDSTPGAIETTVRFLLARVFHFPGGNYKTIFTGLEWYVDGALYWSVGTMFSETSGMAPFASSIPWWGSGITVGGSVGHAEVGPMGCSGFPLAVTRTTTNTGTVVGGFRTKIDGAWRTQPIALMPHLASGIASASDCYNISIAVENTEIDATHSRTFTSQTGEVLVYPNESAGVVRINDDYEALIFRWGFPKVTRWDISGSNTGDCTGEPTSTPPTPVDTVLYPLDTQFIGTVGNSAHVIETPMTRTKYALVRASRSTIVWTTGGSSTTQIGSGYYTSFDLSTINADYANTDPDLGWMATYANTIITPQASYGMFLPRDTDPIRWEISGGDVSIDYFENKTRQQHIKFLGLPSGENTGHRVNNVSDAYGDQNGLGGLALALMGSTGFWGVDRIAVSDPSGYPASVTTDSTSSPRWSFFDGGGAGVGTIGTDITLTTGDEVRFALSDYDYMPFMYSAIAKSVGLSWSTTNVSNLAVYARGYDGTEILITNNVQGNFDYPLGPSTEWSTSMGQDFGDPYLSDTYTTPRAGDATTTIIGDEKSMPTFGLMPSHSPMYLVFKVTKTNPANPATIHHPTFYAHDLSTGKVFHPTSRDNVLLFPNGQGVSLGRTEYFNWVTDTIITTPAAIDDPDGTSTMGDGWCFENNFFKAKVADDGLLTRLGAEFLVGEEFPAGILKQAWRNIDGDGGQHPDTVAFLANSDLGPRLLYHSTWRAGAANVWFLPEKKRSAASGWAATGDYGIWRYSESHNKFPVIVPGESRAQLLDSGGSDILSTEMAPSGWAVGSYTISTDGSEGFDWTLKWDHKNWYKQRPWRGNFNVFGIPETTGKALDYAVSRSLKHAWALEKDSRLIVRLNDNNFTLWHEFDVDDPADVVKITWDVSSEIDRLWLITIRSGTLELRHSLDDLASWSTALATFTCDMADIANTDNGITFVYSIESGDLIGRGYDNNLNLVIGPITTNISGIDSDSPLGIDTSVKDGQRRVGATYNIAGSGVFKTSTDFTNFS